MTNRDQRKPPEYWKQMLASLKRWIKDAEKGCATARNAVGRESACRFVWWKRLEHLLAAYSAGSTREQLEEEYAALVPAFVHHATSDEYVGSSLKLFDYYVRMLWLTSIGYLLDDRKGVAAIAKHAKHDGNDALLDRLITFSVPRHAVSDVLIHGKRSQPLLDAVEAKDVEHATKSTRAYLDNYYKAIRPAWFWNRHKSDDTIYFGYWSMESAAVAKAKHLDQDVLAESPYFPVFP